MKLLPELTMPVLTLSLTICPTPTVLGQDIRGYEIDRIEYFEQCTTNRAPLVTARAHDLVAFAIGYYDGALVTGTLSFKETHWPLTNTGSALRLIQHLPGAAAAGLYSFDVTTGTEGVRTMTVAMPPLANRIAPARIANFTEVQGIESTQPFTLQWDAVKDTGRQDKLRLRIVDAQANALIDTELDRTQTSFTIPSTTLGPGTTNRAFLSIVHLAALTRGQNGKPYFAGVEVRSTVFPLRTRRPEGGFLFVSNQQWAWETNGTIHIPVQRNGSEGAVSVDYLVEGVTAQAGVNFTPVSGTLVFPAGVTNQTIAVPLLDDGVIAGPLIARVRLTNAMGGAVLPSRPWLDWSILDAQAAPGPNVNAIVLSKVSFYLQTNDDLGDQSTLCATSRFFASIHPKFPGALSNATLRLPNGRILDVDMPYLTFLEHDEDFPTRVSMDKLFRSGTYTVEVNTLTDGHLSERLREVREPRFPVPHLLNWTEAQSIDPDEPFALHWQPFVGATSNDFLHLSIRDSSGDYLIQTPEAFEAGALTGETTTFEIPAHLLRAGERYLVDLIFDKAARCDVDAVSGLRRCVLFAHTTGFYVHTVPPAAASSPNLTEQAIRGTTDCCSGVPNESETGFQSPSFGPF